tara:strand:- start:5450 stop:5839 length:390 start_codon:yes stop_codon:yes gene_type:complete
MGSISRVVTPNTQGVPSNTPAVKTVKRPNPGKNRPPDRMDGGPVFPRPGDEFTAMPGGPEGKPTLPEDPNAMPQPSLRERVMDIPTRVGAAVTGQLVPLATQIAQQNQKKGPRRRQPTQGTLGSSGSLL